MTHFGETASEVLAEMLEPVGSAPSRLEWLADWLDQTDPILGVPADHHDVQDDLRRWARVLRGDTA